MVRSFVALSIALAAIVIVVVAVRVAVVFAWPIETRPPPPFDEIAATLPRLSVWMTMFSALICALPPIVFVNFGVTEAVDVADFTSTTPPPEPEPEAVAIPSPDGAPGERSAPADTVETLLAGALRGEVEDEVLVAASRTM